MSLGYIDIIIHIYIYIYIYIYIIIPYKFIFPSDLYFIREEMYTKNVSP